MLAKLPHARRGRTDDHLTSVESRNKTVGEGGAHSREPAISVHLAAARLIGRVSDLVSEPFENLHSRNGGGGADSLAEAGYK